MHARSSSTRAPHDSTHGSGAGDISQAAAAHPPGRLRSFAVCTAPNARAAQEKEGERSQPRTRRPDWEPSSAICRVLMTDSGYSMVVRPCSMTRGKCRVGSSRVRLDSTARGGAEVEASSASTGSRRERRRLRFQARCPVRGCQAHTKQARSHNEELLLVQPAGKGYASEGPSLWQAAAAAAAAARRTALAAWSHAALQLRILNSSGGEAWRAGAEEQGERCACSGAAGGLTDVTAACDHPPAPIDGRLVDRARHVAGLT